jgi:maleate cis-trans isomerase
VNLLPTGQLGYILPTTVGDAIHHQFYRVCPPDMMLIACPINLGAFSADGVEAALTSFWPAFDFLVARKVDRIVQGGIPVSAIAGRRRILGFIEEARRRSSIPLAADFEECVEGFKALGCRRIAIAAKWDDKLMGQVAQYLREAGLEPLGWASQAHTASQVMDVRPQDGIDLAIALGRRAFAENPQADALLLAGGAWLSLAAIPVLEREFGRPVIANPAATYWAAMKQLGRSSPEKGCGILIDSLSPASLRRS